MDTQAHAPVGVEKEDGPRHPHDHGKASPDAPSKRSLLSLRDPFAFTIISTPIQPKVHYYVCREDRPRKRWLLNNIKKLVLKAGWCAEADEWIQLLCENDRPAQ